MSKANKLTVNLYRDGSLESSHEVNVNSNNKQSMLLLLLKLKSYKIII